MESCVATEVAAALDRVADAVRAFVPQVRLQPDGSGPPQMLAFRDALMAFPIPTEVLFINARDFETGRDGGPVWTLLRFDFLKHNTPEVRFAASLRAANLPKHASMLEEHFGIGANTQKPLWNLSLVSGWDDDKFTFLAPFDIRTQPEQFGLELVRYMQMDERFVRLFLRGKDFTSRYGLEPDRILADQELLRFDKNTGEYVDCSLQRCSLRERQERVAGIQLIPQVPESVKRVIDSAKRLYIFGNFEYSFFTIAKSYAYAAMESALHNRWNATLPNPTVLRHQKNKSVAEDVSVERSGHRKIKEYCKINKWNVRKVSVNGRQFPFTAGMVVDWLRDDGIINDWQKKRFIEVYLELRNAHSHLEFCSIEMPGASTIADAVEEINTLFDSLPIGFGES